MSHRILLFAGGGGYDIVTVHLLADILKKRAIYELQIDLIGIQNPKFQHFFIVNGQVEGESQIHNFQACEDASRYYRSHDYMDPGMERDYVYYREFGTNKDWVDARVSKASDYTIYSSSTRMGVDALVLFMSTYQEVYLCDVGGDILYSGKKDQEIKTPYLDAFSLIVMKKLSAAYQEIRTGIYIIAPGSDLELTPEHLEENMRAVWNDHSYIIDIEEKDFERIYSLYQKVMHNNSGKTIQRISGALCGTNDQILLSYRRWLTKIYFFETKAVVDFNPLTTAENFTEVVNRFQEINQEVSILGGDRRLY